MSLALVGCTVEKPGSGSGGEDTGSSPDTGVEAPDPRFDALRSVIESDLSLSDAPGVSVAVYQDGAIIFAEGFGSAHPLEDVPVTPDTLFQIGSTTKMLTAIAMLQDVEDGALSLDESLAEAYPASEFRLDADWNDQIVLQHLLTHQGALYEYYDLSADPTDGRLASWHEEVYFEDIWVMNPPGAFWNYSNMGYSIAGMIVESMAGQSYPDLMDARVFTPLGMVRTYQRHSEAEADGDYALGVGYITDSAGYSTYGPVLMPDVPDSAVMRPAGGGTWSTPTQMMSVADFLLNGAPEVLGDEWRSELTSRQVGMLDVLDAWGYGYGVMVGEGMYLGQEWQETEIWAHNGMTSSYTSEFYVLPEHNFAVSILSSGYATDFSGSVGAAISTLVDLGSPETDPLVSYDPKRLEDHAGTYQDVYNVGEIIISHSGGALYIEMPDLDALGYSVTSELYIYSEAIFYVEIEDYWYELKFIGEPGSPSEYVANRSFVGSRTEPPVEPIDTGDPEE
jgi:CubicO group peptidase (beta-lactamase class C family)